jgi:hypothetical protein
LVRLASTFPSQIVVYKVDVEEMLVRLSLLAHGKKRAEEREILKLPTVELYRNACRIDRLEQPTRERLWKHATALKEVKLSESGFITNILPGR